MGLFSFARAYNRPQEAIAPSSQAPQAQLPIDYSAFGYVPNVAQNAQQTVYVNPFLNPQPIFSNEDLQAANWFTNRVHLSPLGKVS